MVSFLQGLVAGDVFFDNFFVSGNPTPQNQLFWDLYPCYTGTNPSIYKPRKGHFGRAWGTKITMGPSTYPSIQVLGWSSPISSMGLVYLPTSTILYTYIYYIYLHENHKHQPSNIDIPYQSHPSINMGLSKSRSAPVFVQKNRQSKWLIPRPSRTHLDSWVLFHPPASGLFVIHGCFNAYVVISDIQLEWFVLGGSSQLVSG